MNGIWIIRSSFGLNDLEFILFSGYNCFGYLFIHAFKISYSSAYCSVLIMKEERNHRQIILKFQDFKGGLL